MASAAWVKRVIGRSTRRCITKRISTREKVSVTALRHKLRTISARFSASSGAALISTVTLAICRPSRTTGRVALRVRSCSPEDCARRCSWKGLLLAGSSTTTDTKRGSSNCALIIGSARSGETCHTGSARDRAITSTLRLRSRLTSSSATSRVFCRSNSSTAAVGTSKPSNKATTTARRKEDRMEGA